MSDDDREFESASRNLVERLAGDGSGGVRPGITWWTLVQFGDTAYRLTVHQYYGEG